MTLPTAYLYSNEKTIIKTIHTPLPSEPSDGIVPLSSQILDGAERNELVRNSNPSHFAEPIDQGVRGVIQEQIDPENAIDDVFKTYDSIDLSAFNSPVQPNKIINTDSISIISGRVGSSGFFGIKKSGDEFYTSLSCGLDARFDYFGPDNFIYGNCGGDATGGQYALVHTSYVQHNLDSPKPKLGRKSKSKRGCIINLHDSSKVSQLKRLLPTL